jgi:predicted outer membrane protein
MRATRWLRLATAVLAGLAPIWLSATAASAAPAPSATEEWIETKWGPLGPVDKELLAGVRRAGLWETPAGQMAMEKGGAQRVKQIGKSISQEHVDLDGIVRGEASKVAYTLPNQPNADQQKWLKEMEEATPGAEFDKVFVERLRAAHGKVYSLIASVRAGTRNSLMREFAETCETYVQRHMGYLESTGLVNFDSLPAPVGLAPATKAPQAGTQQNDAAGPLINPASSTSGGLSPYVIWAVLIAAAIAGGLATLRVLRSSR